MITHFSKKRATFFETADVFPVCQSSVQKKKTSGGSLFTSRLLSGACGWRSLTSNYLDHFQASLVQNKDQACEIILRIRFSWALIIFGEKQCQKGVLPPSVTPRFLNLWAIYWIQSVGVGPELICLGAAMIPHWAWKKISPVSPPVLHLFTSVLILLPAVSLDFQVRTSFPTCAT